MTRIISVSLAVALIGAAVSAQQVSDPGSLMNEFAKAVKADDFTKQTSLLDDNKKLIDNGFMAWEQAWCRLSVREDESSKANAQEIMTVLEAMASVNSIKGNRSNFLLQRVPWLQGLSVEQKNAKVKMRTIIDAAAGDFNRLAKVPAEEDIRKLVPNYALAVAEAKKATDQYWGANSCWLAADLMSKVPDWYAAAYWFKVGASFGDAGHAKDLVDAWALAKRGMDAAKTGKLKYELIDIEETDLAKSKAKHDAAVDKAAADALAGGGGKPTKPGEKPNKGFADMAPMPTKHPAGANKDWEEVSGLKVSKLKKRPTSGLPGFRLNTHWYFWGTAYAEKGQSLPAPLLPGDTVLENDKGKLFLHPGGKGEGKPIRLKIGPKPKVLQFKKVKYSDGSQGNLWHEIMLFPSSYQMNGFQFRGGGNVMAIRYRGASVVKAKVRDVAFEIHDGDGDGKFDSWGNDYIVIGKGKSAIVQPLSKYMTLNGLMYEFKIDQSGKAIRTRPYDGPVAPLKFEYAGNMKPGSMLARGTGEEIAYAYDLMHALDKPMWVVPGVHTFAEGYIAKGKGAKRQTIWIQRGRSGTMNVAAGTLNTWEMGGAGESGFTMSFKAESRREKGKSMIVIPGTQVKVFGNFGEEYTYSMFGQVLPKVQVRKGKDGPIVARGAMRKPERADVNQSSTPMWFPKTLELKKSFSGEFSVKLEADFKPLGKIKSDWTAGN